MIGRDLEKVVAYTTQDFGICLDRPRKETTNNSRTQMKSNGTAGV
jgi:hypothetical protein